MVLIVILIAHASLIPKDMETALPPMTTPPTVTMNSPLTLLFPPQTIRFLVIPSAVYQPVLKTAAILVTAKLVQRHHRRDLYG